MNESLDESTELVGRCRAGDPLAWESLVRRYQGRVFAVALHYMRHQDEARDLAQDVFVHVWRRLDRFDGSAFLPWLLRVARNRAIDRLRRRDARPPTADVRADTVEIADSAPGPGEASDTEEARLLVHRAMGDLSEISREMLLLKEIQGLSLVEIAALLKLPVGTVKSRSHRARLELADRITAIEPSWGRP